MQLENLLGLNRIKMNNIKIDTILSGVIVKKLRFDDYKLDIKNRNVR